MPKTNGTETFTEMRNRLMEVHGWCRKIATIAARYYLGVENHDDLRARTQEQPVFKNHCHQPDLSLAMAHEIAMLR
jgi:hypothetical protein